MQAARVRIKFCGMTNVDDAVLAANLGVDAIGLIFYALSSRNVSIEQAREISSALPPFVSSVGVFVNPTVEFMREILNRVPLNYLQFHGEESPEFCSAFNLPYIKTIHVGSLKITTQYEHMYSDACAFLFDTYHEDQRGGTGKVFDWQNLPKNTKKPILLSGGINSSNVTDAIRVVHPYGIDVTSGVEAKPGIKDKTKMLALINQIQESNDKSVKQ